MQILNIALNHPEIYSKNTMKAEGLYLKGGIFEGVEGQWRCLHPGAHFVS
jgi:hypothetical protein